MSKRTEQDDDTQAVVHTDGQFAVTVATNPETGELNVEIAFRGGEGQPTAYIAYLTPESAYELSFKADNAVRRIEQGV